MALGRGKGQARCTCTKGDSIIDVAIKVLSTDFEMAKLHVAELLGRRDLVVVKGGGFQATNAGSLLNAPNDNRDDDIVRSYLAHRLGVEPGEVPMPSTPATGIKALAYFDPPAGQKGKPKLVRHHPCAVDPAEIVQSVPRINMPSSTAVSSWRVNSWIDWLSNGREEVNNAPLDETISSLQPEDCLMYGD